MNRLCRAFIRFCVITSIVSTQADIYPSGASNRYLVDKIDAVVMGYQGDDVFTELIMRSDSERPNLQGQIIELPALVEEAKYYIDARRLRAVVTDDYVDMILASLQHAYNLTKEGLEEVIKGLGYSVEEGRRMLGRMNTISSLLDMRVTGNIFIQKDQAEAYYNANPAYHDGVYTLQRAIITFKGDKQAQEQELKNLILTHADGLKATWSDAFTIEFAEIAPEKAVIHTAKLNDIVLTGQTADGFELYRLVDKKEPLLKTFEERYEEIVTILRRPQEEILLASYKESLDKKLVVEYL